jgi:PhzF family phenazine biosynthesis protein
MGLELYQVDAFTAVPFKGNPAAVCLLDAARPEAWMQAVAMEMNLSETAFLVAHDGDDADYGLRWFTPQVEIDLCGHATLACAHTLWETRRVDMGKPIRFATRSGVLTTLQHDGLIEMDFPASSIVKQSPPAGLLEALGVAAEFVGRTRFDYLVQVANASSVRALAPDFGALRKIPVRGVMVTARGDDGKHDFVSRFFGPGSGIDEDPVTGSAHCALGPYWQAILGKPEMRAHQASARGGEVRVRVAGERVFLGGRAVTVMMASLNV